MAAPSPIIIPAVLKHTATVIVAHGLGDSGAGWVWLAESWRRRKLFEGVKFIFPNAPMIPISVVCAFIISYFLDPSLTKLQNMGMSMPGWYDIVR